MTAARRIAVILAAGALRPSRDERPFLTSYGARWTRSASPPTATRTNRTEALTPRNIGSSIGSSRSLRLAAWRMMFSRDRSSPHCFSTWIRIAAAQKPLTALKSMNSAGARGIAHRLVGLVRATRP
jgi:hypothetical protein